MKKVLFVASMLRGHILVFHLPYMRWFRERGYEVHVCAANDTDEAAPVVPDCDRYIEMPYSRSLLNRNNLAAYRLLRDVIDREEYTLIHCHTPIGGALTRLAAMRARKRGTRVMYTAHGFHFFTGAPLKNWLIYYPVERTLARVTDALLTINREDYERAKRFKAGTVALVNGVGVDLSRFEEATDRVATRAALGLTPDAPVVITVGEHIPRKNHETCLRAVAALPRATLLLCGVGYLEDDLKRLSGELGLGDRARFLGFRKDVPALLQAADAFVFPSLQEGLPMALMEAMAAGLPCVASRVRGNADLLGAEEGGFLCAATNAEAFAKALGRLLDDRALSQGMGRRNRVVAQGYGLRQTLEQVEALYLEQLREAE